MRLNSHHDRWRGVWLAAMAVGILPLGVVSCRDTAASRPSTQRPNIVWVVWDAVRADHLSVYGYAKPTTPRLGEWARQARVYDNCTSAASTTTPSHASMFTGLLPTEHGASEQRKFLDDRYTTVAELLHTHGYQTYLYSANPHIARTENFQRGFDVEEHPWDPQYKQAALRIVQSKLPPQDRSSELPDRLRAATRMPWVFKASGELTHKATAGWLQRSDPKRPVFLFLNYMEAHRPVVPPEMHRRRLMTPEQVARSYQVDRSWTSIWSYTFGLQQYTEEELEITAATYDAALAELDDLFQDLLAALAAANRLENTVIILTADHGEHLGEHHILDHQYSLYEPLLRVPLIVHYPARFAPGRDARPVVNFDLFPTLLELAGIDAPTGLNSQSVSLLAARDGRVRMAEYSAYFEVPFQQIRAAHPTWDSRPWQRTLRALYSGAHKYIWASDGRNELYDLGADPRETNNLIDRTDLAKPLATQLAEQVAALRPAAPLTKAPAGLTPEEVKRLATLGYVALEQEKDPDANAPTTTRAAPAP